ncbi:hypothetical protein ACWEV3_32810, partial [Saccharopolyspora sp. NPDC003752]
YSFPLTLFSYSRLFRSVHFGFVLFYIENPKARTALDPLTQNECGNRRFGGKGWTSTGVEVAG